MSNDYNHMTIKIECKKSLFVCFPINQLFMRITCHTIYICQTVLSNSGYSDPIT